MIIRVFGAEEIKNNLILAGKITEKGLAQNLKRAGLYLQRQSQKVVPVDQGNLKGSAGTKAEGTGWTTVVTVYYTAEYAIYVHERTDLKHQPGKIAKFLETPMRENKREILDIIAGKRK